jgi:predicted dehydrogenase
MHIDFHGRPVDRPTLRVGLVGCGSHAFRNIAPTFHFVPVELVATCDVDARRAEAFAAKLGARAAYTSHLEMLESVELDAVFAVLPLDAHGRPQYPRVAVDCLQAGCHVWIEKPPAASTAELDEVRVEQERAQKNVMVGFKKMFVPANEKAKSLMTQSDFGATSLVRVEYPERLPSVEEFRAYEERREPIEPVVEFLEHVCHPLSLLHLLLGMPTSLYYVRSANGAGMATFGYASGAIASLALTSWGGASDGLERTVIGSDSDRRIVVENNLRVSYHRMPFPGYGDVPDFYGAGVDEATSCWEPEFSLGQLYNKGLFLVGYYGEIREFVDAALEGRSPAKATLADAVCITRLFEAFARGPETLIHLDASQEAP